MRIIFLWMTGFPTKTFLLKHLKETTWINNDCLELVWSYIFDDSHPDLQLGSNVMIKNRFDPEGNVTFWRIIAIRPDEDKYVLARLISSNRMTQSERGLHRCYGVKYLEIESRCSGGLMKQEPNDNLILETISSLQIADMMDRHLIVRCDPNFQSHEWSLRGQLKSNLR